MAKRKPKTIAHLVDDAAVLLQKLVRMKAADEYGYAICVCCGKREHWKLMDGGHFISRKWIATKIMEESINPSCKRCNGFLHGNLVPFTLYMIEFYGKDFVEELQIKKNEIKKYTRDEIAEITKDFKERIKELEE